MVLVMKSLKYIIFTILMMNVAVLFSQSVDIERVITDNYPTLRAEFRVLDANGDEVRNLSTDDFELKDNGEITDITAPICPPDLARFSLIMIFDASNSMDGNLDNDNEDKESRLDVIRKVAETFIDQLPVGQFEAAMGFFSRDFRPEEGYLDFTTDKDELKNNLNNYRTGGATNYTKAFLGNDNNYDGGAFGFVQRAQYKPIIVFLSDGFHSVREDINTSEINRKASETNTTVFSVLIGPLSGDDNSSSESFLKSLATRTGGKFEKNLVNERDIQRIYSDILEDAKGYGTPAPCYVDFESGCADGEIELTYSGFDPSVSDTETYTIDDDVKPNLDIDERTFLEVNLPLNQATQIDVEIKAEKNFLEITGFNSTPANIFTVSDWGGSAPPFTLSQDESRTIKVEITPDNREFFGGNITFEGTGCSGLTMTPRAGFIFAEDITFGSVNQGENKTETFTQRFCNLTDEPLEIDRIIITGGAHQSDFAVTSQDGTLAPGVCIDIEAYFSPSEQGDREAEYTVRTDKGDFSAKLKGGGAGNPEIAGVAPEFADVNCTAPTSNILVDITNNGPVDLEVTDAQLADGTHFNVVNFTPFTVAANSTNSTDLEVEFAPQTGGTHSTDLILTNNSVDSPYNITITGEMIDIDYTTSANAPIDFGTICANVGSPITQQITLTNLNTFGYNVTANSDTPEFTVDASDYDITSGNATVTISFESGTNGTYNGQITFESGCGNVERIVDVTGKINSPEVNNLSEVIASVVGSSDTKTITITNPNNDPIDVINAFVGDAAQSPMVEFSVSNTSFTVPGNGTYDLDVMYTPDANNPNEVNGTLYLVVEQPCDVTLDNILVKGVPDLAIANLDAISKSDYIGATTGIEFLITTTDEFKASGTTKIEFTLQYDETMLRPLSGNVNGTNEVSYVVDLPVAIPNLVSFTPDFEVLNSLPIVQSDLTIISSQAINDNGDVTATVVNTNGIFNIIMADGDVNTNDLSAKPGEEFGLPIFILDDDNNLDQNLHKEIKVKVNYNYTVMQPIDLDFTKLAGDRAELEFTSEINYSSNPKEAMIQATLPITTIRMLAKLGNEQISDIEITSADITSDGIAVLNLDTKKFTLDGVCEVGGNLRLFTLSEIEPSIRLNRNPVTNKIEAVLSSIETGQHSVVLYDMVGNATELDNRVLNTSGQIYNVEYETNSLQSGVYIIKFNTPTQSFDERLMIVK